MTATMPLTLNKFAAARGDVLLSEVILSIVFGEVDLVLSMFAQSSQLFLLLLVLSWVIAKLMISEEGDVMFLGKSPSPWFL